MYFCHSFYFLFLSCFFSSFITCLISCLFSVCVDIVGFSFVVAMKFLYVDPQFYLFDFNWQPFKFKHVPKEQYFLLPSPIFHVFDIFFTSSFLILFLLILVIVIIFLILIYVLIYVIFNSYYMFAFPIGIFPFPFIIPSFPFREDPSTFLLGYVYHH